MMTVRLPALVLACALGSVASEQEAYSPARYRAGAVPDLPAMVVGGGQVMRASRREWAQATSSSCTTATIRATGNDDDPRGRTETKSRW
jgi:hypothetical protein